jgi:hypothetical protein
MKYLLLLAGDEAAEEALPEAERRRILDEHGKFAASLTAENAYVFGAALAPSVNATTVSDDVLTDGPDLDRALEYTRRIPKSPGLRVEVRPLMEM